MAKYSAQWNADLADEIDALPSETSAISQAITDYAKLRDRIRLCETEKEKL
jgi:hypothetical protein